MQTGPPQCANGCGRAAFRSFATCCVRCTGAPDSHNHDCFEKHKQTVAAFESKKRKRDEDVAGPQLKPTCNGQCACRWSEPIELTDGLSYRWMAPAGDFAKTFAAAPAFACMPHTSPTLGPLPYPRWHGHGDGDQMVNIEFFGSRKADGTMGKGPAHGSIDYLSTRGYIGFSDPRLLVKVNDEVLIPEHLGEGFCGGMGGGVASTDFRKRPGAVVDFPTTAILLKLDDAGVAAADAVRRTAVQHPRAFAAFLDRYGAALSVELRSADVSNKATYADLTVRTPAGTAFELEARMGGVFMSERRLQANLQAKKVAQVRVPPPRAIPRSCLRCSVVWTSLRRRIRSPPLLIDCCLLARQLRELESLGADGYGTYCRIRLITQGADLESIGPDGFQLRAAP